MMRTRIAASPISSLGVSMSLNPRARNAGTVGTGSPAAFPPKTRVAVAQKESEQPPARAPWADGGPSFAQQVTPPTPQPGGQASSAVDVAGGSSSGSPAAGEKAEVPKTFEP